MGRPSRMLESLRTAVEQRVLREFASNIFEPAEALTPEEELEQRRSELRNGQAAVVFVREDERPKRQRCGDCGRLFGERGRKHEAEDLETVRPGRV